MHSQTYSQMYSQMQSLDIKQPAEQLNQAKVSTILTDCYQPTTATKCSAIKSSATRCPTAY